MKEIFSLGHSSHTFETFTGLLKLHGIELLIDVRRFPGSRRHIHFSKDFLSQQLPEYGISYRHEQDLGGRRNNPPLPFSVWRNPSFAAYEAYKQTSEFILAAEKLEQEALSGKLAFMCSEGLWWNCHRRLIASWLVNRGWKVLHIMPDGKLQVHPNETQGLFPVSGI